MEGSTYIFLAFVNLNLLTFWVCSIIKVKTTILKQTIKTRFDLMPMSSLQCHHQKRKACNLRLGAPTIYTENLEILVGIS